MTRKDYIAIAAQIRRTADDVSVAGDNESALRAVWTLDFLADRLADVFLADNPRFSRERFISACGTAEIYQRMVDAGELRTAAH